MIVRRIVIFTSTSLLPFLLISFRLFFSFVESLYYQFTIKLVEPCLYLFFFLLVVDVFLFVAMIITILASSSLKVCKPYIILLLPPISSTSYGLSHLYIIDHYHND